MSKSGRMVSDRLVRPYTTLTVVCRLLYVSQLLSLSMDISLLVDMCLLHKYLSLAKLMAKGYYVWYYVCYYGKRYTSLFVDRYAEEDENTESHHRQKMKATILIQLTGAAILSLFTCLFQVVSFAAALALYKRMDAATDLALDISDNPKESKVIVHSPQDKALILWTAFMGLFDIFFDGTLVIFSSWFNRDQDKQLWLTQLWQVLGRFDARYANTDAYIIVSSAMLSCVIGPTLLLSCWATYEKESFRYDDIPGQFLSVYAGLCTTVALRFCICFVCVFCFLLFV